MLKTFGTFVFWLTLIMVSDWTDMYDISLDFLFLISIVKSVLIS